MKFFKFIALATISLGSFGFTDFAMADSQNPQSYKVLSSKNDQFSVVNVKKFLDEGDEFIKKGNYEKAKVSYDKARNLAKQLSGFFRDLNGSFRGIDARIPREMDIKGRETLKIWAESNAKLAKLYKLKKQPEVAVPLLVEIIKLMSPSSSEGKSAYNELINLGFVETPYKGI
tara:strand:- start:786 stop:1304 length:519 start_codon:yes stop_codon:yes gene_type:complete